MKANSDAEGPDMVEIMSPEAFKKWRKSLNMKQKEAADALGLKKRIIQYYEKGKRDGKRVIIPRTVRLACYAVSQGIADFDGARPAHFKAPKVAHGNDQDTSAHRGHVEP